MDSESPETGKVVAVEYDPEPTLSAFARGEYERVMQLARPYAEAGNSWAQCNVSMLYQFGLGVEKDVLEAERWLLKAAAQDNCVAWNNLGTLYAMCYPELAEHCGETLKCFLKAKELGFNCADPYPPPYLLQP